MRSNGFRGVAADKALADMELLNFSFPNTRLINALAKALREMESNILSFCGTEVVVTRRNHIGAHNTLLCEPKSSQICTTEKSW